MSFGAGTASYTVQSIMDRLFVQILTPPDKQGIQVRLGVAVDASQTTITLGGFTIREDEALLRQGSIVEAEQELLRVVSYDSATQTIEVIRGEYGTIKAAHVLPLLLNVNPPYTRAVVFEAVADNIIQLFPKLFTTNQEYLSSVGSGVFPIEDALAVSVISAWADGWGSSVQTMGEVVDFHQLTGGRAFIINDNSSASMWFRYRRRMAKATAESDVLSDLGVDERWAVIVLIGAAADLLIGRDLTAVQSEWIKNVLEAENIRVGTRISLAGGLRQYHNALRDDAAKEMRSEYKPKIRMRDPMKSIV